MRDEDSADQRNRPLLTTGQVARDRQVSLNTILRAIEAGHLPATRTSPRGHWRVDPADAALYDASLASPGADSPAAA